MITRTTIWAARRVSRRLYALLLASLISTASGATVIIVEPDDSTENTVLSAVSPYVTLVGFNGADVYATTPRHEFPAPTGNLTFGSFPNVSEPGSDGSCFLGVESSTNGICYVGFGMFFHKPVDWVSLLAINYGYTPGLSVQWEAYDESGIKLKNGFFSGDNPDNFGEPFSFKISVPNMTSLMVGGASGIDAMDFDRLIFKVPETGSFHLLATGLIGLLLFRRRIEAQLRPPLAG